MVTPIEHIWPNYCNTLLPGYLYNILYYYYIGNFGTNRI